MAILVGVDEAGYAPNYGPLVVAATAWRVDDGAIPSATRASARRAGSIAGESTATIAAPQTADGATDLYKLLRKAVVRLPDKRGKRLAIADSKALYKAGFGVRQLERGVLAAIAAVASRDPQSSHPMTSGSLIAMTMADPVDSRCALACHVDDEQPLPWDATPDELPSLAALLVKTCDLNGVSLLAIRARLVFPAEFNDLVDHFGTKGAALSHVTLQLVREVLDSLPTAHGPLPTLVSLDKHGGRNRYAALLQHHFSESWIEPVSENRNRSRYRFRHGEAPVEAVFRVGCEELLPTALASMTAKYHRELAMRAFNNFWTARVPNLRPTCGYPGDAPRFRAEIAPVQCELAIDDRLIWRSR